MKEELRKKSFAIEDMFDRRLPLALLAAFLLQAGAAVWWAATKDSDDRFARADIDRLSESAAQTRDAESRMLERLARIEERVDEEMTVLDRLDHLEHTEKQKRQRP